MRSDSPWRNRRLKMPVSNIWLLETTHGIFQAFLALSASALPHCGNVHANFRSQENPKPKLVQYWNHLSDRLGNRASKTMTR